MPVFTQIGRPLQVKSPLGDDALLLAAVRGTEAVSELFEFELHLLAPNDLPPVAFDALFGKPMAARVELPDGGERWFHGVVAALERAERDAVFTHWYATLRPNLWAATLRTNSRNFQQKTAVEILATVMNPVEWQVTGTYPQRDFCVQYQETDFAFASRILEEEGLFYWFRHEEKGHTLVVSDGVAAAPNVPGPLPLRFDEREAPGVSLRDARVRRWRKRQEACATQVTVWDSHFELFRQNFAAEATVATTVKAGDDTHALAPNAVPTYLHDGDYAKRYDGVAPGGGDQSSQLPGVYTDATRTARLRAEQAAARSVRVAGEGNVAQLTPGHTFDLVQHFADDGKWLVTRAEHEIMMQGAFWSDAGGGTVAARTRFDASPLTLVPRPARRTPRPRIGGPLTAVVVGPPGDEIFVDKYGRIKVRFLWDRQAKDDAGASCWVRVAQLWAGKTWGAFFWPRVGMEVVVHFEDGDPDRPVVTGCVYNAANMPPTALPGEATVGGIKSLIFGGDPATQFNSLYFHDTAGVEYVQVHSERGEVQRSEAGKYHYTGTQTFTVQGHL